MKTIIILIGPRQLEDLIQDLQAGEKSPETRTIVLILSEQAIHVRNGEFTFPEEANFYVGPIHTLGFRSTLDEIQKQLNERRSAN